LLQRVKQGREALGHDDHDTKDTDSWILALQTRVDEAAAAALLIELQVASHASCLLVKMNCPHDNEHGDDGKAFTCRVCDAKGVSWCYRCAICDYDVHVACALKESSH